MTRRQSSLPPELTRAAVKEPGFSYGFARSFPEKETPPPDPNAPAVVTDFRQHNFNSRTIVVGASAEIIVGANELRRFLAFQNNGTAPVVLGFDSPPDINGNNGFLLAVNGYLSFEYGIVPNNAVWAISSIAVNVTVIEGTV